MFLDKIWPHTLESYEVNFSLSEGDNGVMADLWDIKDGFDRSMAEDRHAILGYAFLIHGSAISWSTKQQEIITLLTTEAEYVAITHSTKEALWLCSLLFQLFDTVLDPTTLFLDNQSAIQLSVRYITHSIQVQANKILTLSAGLTVYTDYYTNRCILVAMHSVECLVSKK